MNQCTLNVNIEISIVDLLENDIFMQENTCGTIIWPIPNIRIPNTFSYPCRVYIAILKADVWLYFCLMYKETDRCPLSDSF